MWVIFNPTPNDLNYDIEFSKWSLKAGETKKFPNNIAEQMITLHGFLKVLSRDDKQSLVQQYKPPKDLKTVQEAVPEQLVRDRRIKHPSSDPSIKESMGFGSKSENNSDEKLSDIGSGLPPTYRKSVEEGKLISFDKDGVGWYGEGISVDNPLTKE